MNIYTHMARPDPCPEGKVRDKITKLCREPLKRGRPAATSVASASAKPCPPGKERNPVTRRCRNIVSAATKTLKTKLPIPPSSPKVTSRSPHVVVMVGYPGSGKSTVSEKMANENKLYHYLSGDLLKTSTKMINNAEKHMKEHPNASFIFDATNPTIEKRAEYIAFAHKHHLPVRCIHMTTSYEESMHRNKQRPHPIPAIAFNVYRKRFETPTKGEGFNEIIQM